MDRRLFLMGAAGAAASPAWADPVALGADLPLLRRIYETLHPGLYRYQTPLAWAKDCEDLAAALRRPADVAQQYLALSRLAGRVKCGHTYANFFNQSKAIRRRLIEPANRLPFHLVWLGDRMVVTGNPLGVDGIARGTEILTIDGVAVSRIRRSMLPLIRADGNNDAKRCALMNVQGVDRIETFDVYYPLLFPSDRPVFKLGIAGRGQVSVDKIDLATRQKTMPPGYDETRSDYWSLIWRKPAIAVLTMPGWALYDVTWDWRARLDGMFEEMAARGARGLIVDIRENEGGVDCGHEIIARLIDTPLPLDSDYERRVRFRTTPADISPYLDTWDQSFERLGEGAEDLGDGFFRLKADEEGVAVITPRGPRFKGKVVVLSSAQNSSATFQFISLVKRHGLARVYGQTTGGNQRGINGGAFFFVRLPNSGLEIDLPLIGTFPKTPRPDAGLEPDVFVEPSLQDIGSGRDAVLERAIADLA
ncbi:S41 family peptidase [Asticcacaulis sp. AC402]|uniref:S41 family peptidase n=1 Tax=Asticcacaulis sp. AC402 TaxID=1282361 RepID=UPI0003C3AC28|nr:S41 family peptidase [Asticcacaulis sp. AC402]ESQ76339.1 hypothetical protein ABAC402_04370 [Asticcacaulis sp. AC402]